ncbi:MAG TPA: helix-turn-helix domain-containing protein [Gemmataceae bacterium]|nr:helix-turn-helix domain-containing protein [Gemmataceae bacterium]
MPRTTKKPKPKPTPQPAAVNGPPGEVLTLAEAAAYLRLAEKDVITATSTQGLPGRMVAGEWRFFKTALQQWLSHSEPTEEMRKAAQLAGAGSMRDDPDLEDIVEEIYRRRGRPITEDGSYRLFHGLNPEDFKK